MDEIKIVKQQTLQYHDVYMPQVLRLDNSKDKAVFDELLSSGFVFLFDEIKDQLKELFKIRHPKRQLTDADYESLIQAHLGQTDIDAYGVWVYYPWSKRLVHLLDEAEFIEVRTSRNQYKITNKERDLLATKKVGVIGLSVGQSVAVTLAMERSFGEIRLADFDVLELTNLNRIRTGLFNLGIKKVISVAREIAEIDPYLKVTIFEDGLTEENMDKFYLEGGKLDLLIDECDGVDMKILCRIKARELKIPVLMEGSDRCTIDVERFDLEPERSILHGYIDHLDVSKLKHLKTNEEKMPYLAPIVGLATISSRLRASGIEIGQTITTWPQLASAVTLGGGAVADIWRRIALNQYKGSGRFFLDMDELIGDPKTEAPEAGVAVNPFTPLSNDEALQLALKANCELPVNAITIPEPDVEKIVDAAGTAPSGGNAQPWKWVYNKGILLLFFDRYYGYSYMDYKDTASYIALGAAIENAVLKAHELGYEVNVNLHEPSGEEILIADFTFYNTKLPSTEQHENDQLSKVITQRHTNRKITERVMLQPEVLESLKTTAESVPGAQLNFYEDPAILEEIGKIISETDRYRVLYPQSHYDFIFQEMRWTAKEAEERRTGIEISTLELTPANMLGIKLVKDPMAVELLRDINGADILRNTSVKNMTTASVAGLLTMPTYSGKDFINGGRASERLWLKATEMGLAFQPMNVPLAFFARLTDNAPDLPKEIIDEVAELYRRYNKALHRNENRADIYLFRVFKAEAPKALPHRKKLDDILVINR